MFQFSAVSNPRLFASSTRDSLGSSLIVSICFVAAMLSKSAQAAVIQDARLGSTDNYTRLVLEVSEDVKFNDFSLSTPERLVIDLEKSSLAGGVQTAGLSEGYVKAIRTSRKKNGTLRIVLDLKSKVNAKVFKLAPEMDFGHRLVVDLNATANTSAAAGKRAKKSGKRSATGKNQLSMAEQKRDIIVYIDPGHGGKDPGAVGVSGVREKTVVMAISRHLQNQLGGKRGFKARLTRTGDYYVGLRKRTELARKGNANLFVSVHADAFKYPRASGASVYILSQTGASSETARWLEHVERQGELIGGGGSVSLKEKDKTLASVLLDLSMTASLRDSNIIGSGVLRKLGRVSRLHQSKVNKARFMVLRSPDIPSILVETGFISNPVEARKLNTRKYQRQVASSIAEGILAHFEVSPPPNSLLAWERQQLRKAGKNEAGGGGAVSYRIKRGDTLSEIAQRNATTISTLRKLNGLSDNRIRIGQIIRIPASSS